MRNKDMVGFGVGFVGFFSELALRSCFLTLFIHRVGD